MMGDFNCGPTVATEAYGRIVEAGFTRRLCHGGSAGSADLGRGQSAE